MRYTSLGIVTLEMLNIVYGTVTYQYDVLPSAMIFLATFAVMFIKDYYDRKDTKNFLSSDCNENE
jgi:uncharacterized ion transporter superfamily protein YfcC